MCSDLLWLQVDTMDDTERSKAHPRLSKAFQQAMVRGIIKHFKAQWRRDRAAARPKTTSGVMHRPSSPVSLESS